MHPSLELESDKLFTGTNGIISKLLKSNVEFVVVIDGKSGQKYRFEPGSSKRIVERAGDLMTEVSIEDVEEMLKLHRKNKSCCNSAPTLPIYYFTLGDS
jgi:hypothetical protein